MRKGLLLIISLLIWQVNFADTINVPIYSINQQPKQSLGSVIFSDTQYGLLITPALRGLPPGLHGFHVHENPSCANHGLAAGGHYDPQLTGMHLGPYDNNGHLGDLPALYVDNQGDATLPTLAPRLTTKDLLDHAFIIHQGGDNYSDQPVKLGGGGKRIACNIIRKNTG